MAIAAWARMHVCTPCREGVGVETHAGSLRAEEVASELELIAGRMRS
jgi:hypothetical protein